VRFEAFGGLAVAKRLIASLKVSPGTRKSIAFGMRLFWLIA
jgi:hypothetical protein